MNEKEKLEEFKDRIKELAIAISALYGNKVNIRLSANYKVFSCSLNIEEVDI